MRRRLGQRRVRLWAGACCALVATGLLAPGQTRAGCSHYVVARAADGGLGVTALDALELFATAPGAPEAPAVPAPYRAPCAGPSCGRNATPPAAPVVAGPFHADVWAWLPYPGGAGLAFWTLIGDQTKAGRPNHGSRAPERPPR